MICLRPRRFRCDLSDIAQYTPNDEPMSGAIRTLTMDICCEQTVTEAETRFESNPTDQVRHANVNFARPLNIMIVLLWGIYSDLELCADSTP